MHEDHMHVTAPPIPPVAPVYTRTNHTLHLLLSLVTCGAWLAVWPFVAAGNAYSNARSRRLYEAARASYQQALWARERELDRMREQSERQYRDREPRYAGGAATLYPTVPPEFRAGPVTGVSGPLPMPKGDPLQGYRPASGAPYGAAGAVPRWTSGTPAVPARYVPGSAPVPLPPQAGSLNRP